MNKYSLNEKKIIFVLLPISLASGVEGGGGRSTIKEKNLLLWQHIRSFKSGLFFGRTTLSSKTNRKSQKYFSYVKMKELQEVVSIHLNMKVNFFLVIISTLKTVPPVFSRYNSLRNRSPGSLVG